MPKDLLSSAVGDNNQAEIKQLVEQQYSSDHAVRRALECEDIKLAQYLLDYGYQLNYCPCPIYSLEVMEWAHQKKYSFGPESLKQITNAWNGAEVIDRVKYLFEVIGRPALTVEELNELQLDDELATYLVNFLTQSELEAAMMCLAQQGKLQAVQNLIQRGVTFTRQHFELAIKVAKASDIPKFCQLLNVPLAESFSLVMTNLDDDRDDDSAIELLSMYRDELGDQQIYQLAQSIQLWSLVNRKHWLQNFVMKLGSLYQKFDQ